MVITSLWGVSSKQACTCLRGNTTLSLKVAQGFTLRSGPDKERRSSLTFLVYPARIIGAEETHKGQSLNNVIHILYVDQLLRESKVGMSRGWI